MVDLSVGGGGGGGPLDYHSIAETPGSCRMQPVKFRQVSQQAHVPPNSSLSLSSICSGQLELLWNYSCKTQTLSHF